MISSKHSTDASFVNLLRDLFSFLLIKKPLLNSIYQVMTSFADRL